MKKRSFVIYSRLTSCTIDARTTTPGSSFVPNMKAINDKGFYHDFGYRPSEPEKLIVFYLEMFEESSAYYLAARLQKEHWEINVMPAGSCWILLAHALVSPDRQTISDLCDYLSDLSEYHGGSFKRWELDSPS